MSKCKTPELSGGGPRALVMMCLQVPGNGRGMSLKQLKVILRERLDPEDVEIILDELIEGGDVQESTVKIYGKTAQVFRVAYLSAHWEPIFAQEAARRTSQV